MDSDPPAALDDVTVTGGAVEAVGAVQGSTTVADEGEEVTEVGDGVNEIGELTAVGQATLPPVKTETTRRQDKEDGRDEAALAVNAEVKEEAEEVLETDDDLLLLPTVLLALLLPLTLLLL